MITKSPFVFDVFLYSPNPFCCAQRRPLLHLSFRGQCQQRLYTSTACVTILLWGKQHYLGHPLGCHRVTVWHLREFAALVLFWLRLLVDHHAEVLCREHLSDAQ